MIGWGAFHATASITLTFPLVLHMNNRLPLGTEPTSTVAEFNLWTMRWGSAHLVPLGHTYWNAPIFWPRRGAFALSEPQPLTAAMFAATRTLLGPVAAYSFVLLVGITLTGLGAALLAGRLGADPVPAAIVGVLAQSIPFVFDQLGVLQLTMIWPMLFALSFLVAWARNPEPRQVAGFALSIVALSLSCGNHAVLFGLSLVLAAPVLVSRRWHREATQRIGGIAVAAGILIAVAAVVVIPQQGRLDGFTWRRATVLAGSGQWSDWWFANRSWPGVIVILLALFGAWIQRRDRTVWFLVALAAAAFAISFGSRLSIFGWHPWDALRSTVPGIARLRSPWRSATIVQIALVALTVPAVQQIWAARRTLRRTVLMAAIVSGIAIGHVGPGTLVAADVAQRPAVRALSRLDDGGAVLYLPFAAGPGPETFQRTTGVMNELLGTGHPLVNGYSGFFPSDHSKIRDLTGSFPDGRSLDALAERGVQYVLADAIWLKPRRDRLDEFGITIAVDDPQGILLRLP